MTTRVTRLADAVAGRLVPAWRAAVSRLHTLQLVLVLHVGLIRERELGTAREAREAQASSQIISAEETTAWLQDLPALWAAADDSSRRLLTEALFEKVEVLGVQSVTIHPTPEADAHGWSEASGPMPQLIPGEMVAPAIGRDGRGERSRAYTFQVSVTVLDGDGERIVSRSSDVTCGR